MSVWGEKYRDEMKLNVTVLVVRVWVGQFREELILNFNVLVMRVWVSAILRGTDTDYFCVGCEGLGKAM